MPFGVPRTPQQTAERLARMQADWDERGFGRWAVEERDTGRFVGHAGLGVHRLWPTDPELGWGVDPDLWGRGYATEAATAALDHWLTSFAFPRFVSIVHPENAASIRVAEKLGEELLCTVRWPDTGAPLLVFAGRPHDWAEAEREAIVAFTELVALLILNAMEARERGRLAGELQAALDSRVVIEQAKGVLVGRHGLTTRQAFERLRRQARDQRRPLTEVARSVVAAAEHR